MFKLNRHKPEKSRERVDFRFSHFQALQVPKGWDKLFVSFISVESGKTVSKSSKASVRNGTCQWKETITESVWLSQDNTSKQAEECLFKLVISMGSARSGILGEAIINLTTYISSRNLVPLSLPLKKCNHGTIFQVKIQCLNPRTETRDEQWQEATSNLEDLRVDHDEIEIKSDVSDNAYARSVGSSSSNRLGSSSHIGDFGSRNPSFSASGSRHSSDSAEGSMDRTFFSPKNNLNADLYSPIGRQDLSGSHSSVVYGVGPVEDLYRSNHSSFNSKFSNSVANLQNQQQELEENSHLFATSSVKNTNSSKDLLEAAEDTIEELRAEARMWEKNARKLMLDMEALRKESSNQSRQQADHDMELAAILAERNGLKQEIEVLKTMLEESRVKQSAAEGKNTQDSNTHIQKEMEDEIKFQKESNADLALQLKKTQESNIELVSVLQELEETVEKQRLEIDHLSAEKSKFLSIENNGHENEDIKFSVEEKTFQIQLQLQESLESQKQLQATVQHLEKTVEDKAMELKLEQDLRSQTMLDIEAEWKSKLSTKEEEIIKLEAKLSNSHDVQASQEVRYADRGDRILIDENESLKEKVRELEADCNELTEENLDLILKLKESKMHLVTGEDFIDSLPVQPETIVSSTSSESEVSLLRSQIFQLEQEIEKKEDKLIDLQRKFTDLELQFQSSQNKICDLDLQLHFSQVEIEERETKINSLKQQLEIYHRRETCEETERLESQGSAELTTVLPQLLKQLQLTLVHLKNPCYDVSSYSSQKGQMNVIIDNFFELNELLEAKVFKSKPLLQHVKVEVKEKDAVVTEGQKDLGDNISRKNILHYSNEELTNLKMELETKVADIARELEVKRLEIEELEASLLSKQEEIEILKCSQAELKSQIHDIQKEKDQLEENIKKMSREGHVTSQCLEDARNDLLLLTNSLASQVSANKMLEKKSAELENGRSEVELHLSELEEENVQLSERISGLEAQLRYLTDEKESSRLEAENSKSLATSLQNEIKRLKMEIETQRLDLRQKLQDMQQRWSEAQEECEYLKKANPKLQATAENLIEECTSTQKLNGELRKQKRELQERCAQLESKLRESQNNFLDCCKKVEVLESNILSMQESIASKEKTMTSELDAILHENKEHKEKLIMGESLLNQMYLEKTAEVENLQRELAHLKEQISATHDERETNASNAVLEVSGLRADKAKLESALQEAQAKAKSSEMDLHTMQLESERKVQRLISELAASKQNQELLMAEHGKVQRFLDDARFSEERFKTIVNGLELKLTASSYERQQLIEETGSLKVQLQKITQLQGEILSLKNSLSETKFERDKLEASLQLLSGDCEELKTQRDSLVEKISGMQKCVSELEDCKHSRIALEEKILRLEGDLTAKEAFCAQDAELKNELSRVKRANSQLQRKIHSLEEEKDECLKRQQTLEEELNLHEEKQNQSQSSNRSLTGPEYETEVFHEEIKLENEKEKNNGENNENKKQTLMAEQFQRLPNGQQNLEDDQYRKEGDKKNHDEKGSTQVREADLVTKIQLLETELAEALEANNMYKSQLKELLTEGTECYAHASKSTLDNELVSNGRYENKVSSLEAELKDLRERYFNMSLRYAEVEAEREELVMKMRTPKSGRRWFS